MLHFSLFTDQFGYHFKPKFITRVYNFPRHNYSSVKKISNPKAVETPNPVFYKLQSHNGNENEQSKLIIVGFNNLLFVFHESTSDLEEYVEINNF